MESYEELLSRSLPRPPGEEALRKLEELRDLLRATGARDPAIHQAVAGLADALGDGGIK